MEERYQELAQQVDGFHRRVDAVWPGAMVCGKGCSLCCHRHLSVVPLEWERIARAVTSLDEATRRELQARLETAEGDPRCPLLDAEGSCRVYEARPMICRSHGLPIQVGEPPVRDVCSLNFTDGPPMEDLEADLVLDVDRLNVTLGVMSSLAGGDPRDRIELIAGLRRLLDQDHDPG